MNYTLVLILGYSILLPAVIGLIRLSKISRVFYPFLICMWVGLIAEIVSTILARTIHNNSVSNNIYILAESLLLNLQFYNWGLFRRNKRIFISYLIFLALLWLSDNLIWGDLNHYNFYFRIVYSFFTVLFCIRLLSLLIFSNQGNLLKNPVFLIAASLIVYYTLKVINLSFWLYGLQLSRDFRISLTYTMIFVNFFTNLVFALAVLWMPGKLRFTMQY